MHFEIPRRRFLAATAGLVLVTACGGSSDDDDVTVGDDDGATTTGDPSRYSLQVATYVHTTGIGQRFTLALLKENGPVAIEGRYPVTIEDPAGKATTIEGSVHRDGIELPYVLLSHRFEVPGVHDVSMEHDGHSYKTVVQVTTPDAVELPVPGEAAISLPTPTVADAQGVDPICTRKPACPLHEVSLDAALAQQRPIALLFSTPALCQSRLCGPVLENLLHARDAFADRIQMIHAEIFVNLEGKTLAPAVQGYHLESEPFLFLIGADGAVRQRLDNAFDRVEVRDELARLAAG